MLGEYEIEGIESIASAERRALVEHRVPGMDGSYLQDLGCRAERDRDRRLPATATRRATRSWSRSASCSARGEPTTFAADITTATDLTDVVIEDLHVAELAGARRGFRYVLRLRKYVEPPEPASAGLGGLDSDLLDQAASVVGALDTLDALASAPNLGDPTPPLRDAIGGVASATADLEPAATDAGSALTTAAQSAESVPAPDELTGSLSGVKGDAAESTGMAGALGAIERNDVAGRRDALVGQLGESLATAVPAADAAPAAGASEQLADTAAATPAPEQLAAPLAGPLERIGALAGPEAAGAVPAAIEALGAQLSGLPSDPAALFAGLLELLEDFARTGLGGPAARIGEWTGGVEGLAGALEAATAELAREALVAFLGETAEALAEALVPGGGPVPALTRSLDAALGDEAVAAVAGAAGELASALATLAADASPGAAPLAAAEAALDRLGTEAAALAAGVEDAARLPAATPAGLAGALAVAHAGLRGIEVVDLSDPMGAVSDAFGELSAAIEALPFDDAAATAESTLREFATAVQGLGLGQLSEGLDSAQAEVQGALDQLEGALLEVVALVAAAFSDVREALAGVTASLGEIGEDGRFHFHAEAELETMLETARDTIRDDVRPALDEFRTAVEDAMGEVTEALQGVMAELDAAKAQLQAALEQATDQLEAVDVTGTARELVERLGAVLDSLATFDFDTVVDPVVAEIGEMRDQLRAIDPADLNDILRAALAAGTAILRMIDFPADITSLLMGELDELLEKPTEAIAGLQEQLDGAVARFAELDPKMLVEPLQGVFGPVSSALDELDVQALARPLTEWYDTARDALEEIMPARLLAPLVEAHDELVRVLGTVSADAVAGALEEALATAAGELERLDPAALVTGLSGEMDRARELLAALDPEALLAPVIEAHDRIAVELAGLGPEGLLAPVQTLADRLEAPLEGLTDADAARAAAALEPLRSLAATLAPERAFAAAREATASAAERLSTLGLQDALATARARRAEALEALRPTGGALLARVEALDPLAEPDLTQAVASLGRSRLALAGAYADAASPAAAVASYAEVRPVLDALLPPWAQDVATAQGLRGALAWADPAALEPELTGVHEQLVAEWRELDPRRLVAPLAEIHGELGEALDAIDPQALAARVDEVLGGVGERLEALDLDAIRQEAQSVQAEVDALAEGLDPRPVIERLEGLADEVRGLVDVVDPSAILAGLEEPIAEVRAIVDAVSPDAIAEALEPAFARIRELLGDIDIAEALEPLTDRVDALRDELEAALRRTEDAFRELLAAIPT